MSISFERAPPSAHPGRKPGRRNRGRARPAAGSRTASSDAESGGRQDWPHPCQCPPPFRFGGRPAGGIGALDRRGSHRRAWRSASSARALHETDAREIVDKTFDAFGDGGAGALAAWMILSGNRDALNPDPRCDSRFGDQLSVEHENEHVPDSTLWLVLLALGDSLLGGPIASALGLPTATPPARSPPTRCGRRSTLGTRPERSMTMITGAHAMIFTKDEAADRAFLRDVLEIPCIDSGGGWLIFKLPPAELGVHSGENGFHQVYFMCDDVEEFLAEMAAKGVRDIADRRGELGPPHWRDPARRRQSRCLPGAPRSALRFSKSLAQARRGGCISSTRPKFSSAPARGARRGQLSARKVHRIWRARRRSWRQGRRHHLRSGCRSQYPDRLPLHPAFPRAARQGRVRIEPHRRRRRGPGHQGAGRDADPRRRRRPDIARRSHH